MQKYLKSNQGARDGSVFSVLFHVSLSHDYSAGGGAVGVNDF